MISCLVATREGHWAAYALSDEQLQKKEQPTYLSPYMMPSDVWKAIKPLCKEGESDGHTDYGTFWAKVREAGIAVQEEDVKPHRLPMKVEVADVYERTAAFVKELDEKYPREENPYMDLKAFTDRCK